MLNIAFVNSEKSHVCELKNIAWAYLSTMLGDVKISEYKEGEAWMPALIEPGARRGERVQSVSALVLDIEATTSKDQLTGIKTITGKEPPVRLSARAIAWRSVDIQALLDSMKGGAK
jgi:hypothetical protein